MTIDTYQILGEELLSAAQMANIDDERSICLAAFAYACFRQCENTKGMEVATTIANEDLRKSNELFVELPHLRTLASFIGSLDDKYTASARAIIHDQVLNLV